MRKCFVILFLIIPIFHYGQHNTIWTFGDSAGLDFRNLQNVISYDSSVIYYPVMNKEPFSTLCDENGKLLLYATTKKIYSRSHIVIPNGQSFNDNGLSQTITQGVLLLPHPSERDLVYAFMLADTTPPKGLKYSLIDLTLNGGYGDIPSDKKDIYLLKDTLTEKMAAVRHANGRDWWLILHEYHSSSFYKFLITPDSIFLFATQAAGPFIGDSWMDYGGELTFNSTGDQFVSVSTGSGEVNVFSFDRCNGMISSLIDLSEFSTDYEEIAFYGCSFSPSGRYLYVSNLRELFQYDLWDPDPKSTKTSIFNRLGLPSNGAVQHQIGQHELGPDGKIYITIECQGFPGRCIVDSFITVIASPDSPGVACNVIPNAIFLNGGRAQAGLPNFPCYAGAQLGDIAFAADTSSGCIPLQVQFTNNSCGHLAQVWDFGDGSPPDSSENPVHMYAQPGTYNVTLTIINDTLSKTLTQASMITAEDCIFPDFAADTTGGCYRQAVNFTASISGNYDGVAWDFGDGSPPDSSLNPSHLYSNPGNYTVTLTAWNSSNTQQMQKTNYIRIEDCGKQFFGIWPNPGDGDFWVAYSVPPDAELRLELWNVLGQHMEEAVLPAGQQEVLLETRVPAGVYFARFRLNGEEFHTEKLVVVR